MLIHRPSPMPTDLPLWLPLTWLALTVLIQTAVDSPLSRDKLPEMPARRRFLSWLAVNAAVIALLALLFRLTLFTQEQWLLNARDNGAMAFAMLALIVEYFLWGVPYAWGRGRLMLQWRGQELSVERRHEYWGYAWAGSLVGFFLISFLYVTVMLVIPLMAGVDERFG